MMKCSLMWKKCLGSDEGNIGYLLLRVFIGSMFIMHGYGKVFGGLAGFTGYVEKLGIPMYSVLAPVAAYAEFVGGIFLILGVFTRISAFFILCNMCVAFFVAHANDPFMHKELVLVYLFILLMFVLKGGGKYSLDFVMVSCNEDKEIETKS